MYFAFYVGITALIQMDPFFFGIHKLFESSSNIAYSNDSNGVFMLQ